MSQRYRQISQKHNDRHCRNHSSQMNIAMIMNEISEFELHRRLGSLQDFSEQKMLKPAICTSLVVFFSGLKHFFTFKT